MKSLKQAQMDFVAHIKNPDENPYQGNIEDRRLQIYRELFFNNVEGFISSAFPVLKSVYSQQDWQQLVRIFFAEHQCLSPYFIDISKEFVDYLSSEYELTKNDPVFMQELAHYEWLELDVSVRISSQTLSPWNGTDLVSHVSMSELASLVSYQYPVHQISSDFQPTDSSEIVYLVVYRDIEDEVHFTLVNQVTAHLINIIQNVASISTLQLVEKMSLAMPQLNQQQVSDSLQQVLRQLLGQHILLPIHEDNKLL
ncbi:DUF2063 domain-containing protein [Paraglaciecola sp. L3A3]|uniref:HvfC family RiPP maturation protein n=1 Tax=Paraglaciecola sp. L3A3 TaxID=2686358 RepID=UPI00131C6918|nr:putative DNA-binding domain-containing protein [Paraglaciecola sp. L3A3]